MFWTKLGIIALAFCFLSISVCLCVPKEPWISEFEVFKCHETDTPSDPIYYCYAHITTREHYPYLRIINVTENILYENGIKQYCFDAKDNDGKTVKRCRLFEPIDFQKRFNVFSNAEVCRANTFGGRKYDNRSIDAKECKGEKSARIVNGSAQIINCNIEGEDRCYYFTPQANSLYYRVENRDINETPTGHYVVEPSGLIRRIEDTQGKIAASKCLTDVPSPILKKENFCRFPESLGSMSMIESEEPTTKWYSEMKVHACDTDYYVESEGKFYRLTQDGGNMVQFFQVCLYKDNAKKQQIWRCRLLSEDSFREMNKKWLINNEICPENTYKLDEKTFRADEIKAIPFEQCTNKKSMASIENGKLFNCKKRCYFAPTVNSQLLYRVHKRSYYSVPKSFFFTKSNGEMGRVDDVKSAIHKNWNEVYNNTSVKPLKLNDLSSCKQKKELGLFPTWESEHSDREY